MIHQKFAQFSTSILVAALILVSGFLILGQLNQSSLHPWDEAWYASISHNMIEKKDPFRMEFNHSNYWDHPPLGFYLESVSFLILDESAVAARVPQALLGIATVVLLFLIGKKMNGQIAGVIAAIVLLSARWFLFRTQTGNLDILLSFTQALVFYFAIKVKNKRDLYALWASFALSLLSKSIISITLAPLCLWASYEFLQKKRLHPKILLGPFFLAFLILSPWYIVNSYFFGIKFLLRNLFEIGLRNGSAEGISLQSVNQTIGYFHAAAHRWYKPFIFSLIASLPLYILKKNTRNKLLKLWLFLFLVSFPYFISSQAEIWHLIPILTPMSIFVAVIWTKLLQRTSLQLAFLIFIIAIAIISIRDYKQEFLFKQEGISEPEKISSLITDKSLKLYVTTDAYFPSMVYYANMNLPVGFLFENNFLNECRIHERQFQIIAEKDNWLNRILEERNIIAKTEDYLLIKFYKDQDCGNLFSKKDLPEGQQ